MKRGTIDIIDIKRGTTDVSKIYRGDIQVWPDEIPQNIITDGLTIHFDATNNNSYSGSGTTWFNLVSGANNATLQGSPLPIFVSTPPEHFQFSLTNFASAAYSHSNTGSYTMCAWLKTTQSSTDKVFTTLASAAWGIMIFKNPTNLISFKVIRSSPSLAEEVLNSNVVLQSNQWYYVCGTIVPSNILSTNNQKIYINGQLISQRDAIGTVWRTGTTYNIGRVDNQFQSEGDVSDGHIYNRILTDAEILQNFNATKSKYGF
jgi:hypothetical protein